MKLKLFAFITLLLVLGGCAPIPSNLPESKAKTAVAKACHHLYGHQMESK